MSKYKYALFDWDGCLADTLSNASIIYNELAAKNGINFTSEIFKRVVGDWKKSAVALGFSSVDELKTNYEPTYTIADFSELTEFFK
jgi:beta-phosphoglucomutase-like phosphatase (HAD superfamily)